MTHLFAAGAASKALDALAAPGARFEWPEGTKVAIRKSGSSERNALARKRAGAGRARARTARKVPGSGRDAEEAAPPECSVTALAAEALRTGVFPSRRKREALPHETTTICVGDPDDDAMANEYVGDETPGGSASTPDQSNVDEIGRAYGLQEEDTGALQSAGDVLARRDRKRTELRAPGRP